MYGAQRPLEELFDIRKCVCTQCVIVATMSDRLPSWPMQRVRERIMTMFERILS